MRLSTILLLGCFFFNSFQLFAQKNKADSIFYEFEKCLSFYFKKEFKNIDTSYLFFYGNRYNVSMDLKTFDIDGGRSFVNDFRDALDSSHLNDTSHTPIFFRGMSFKDFLNYVISQKTISGNNCLIRDIKGILVFVDCTDEQWQHFYFDRLLYKQGWFVTPVVDVFKGDGKNVQHGRFVLFCSFTPQKGFRVTKKYSIHKYEILCTQ